MKRAAILIGVDKTGNLPELKDAAKGARRMENWAKRQRMDPIKVFTDECGPVYVKPISDATDKIVETGTEQLLIYFAGHGVNIQRNEYWLLSDAPRDTGEAVNVRGSADLAAYSSGISNVVFISDACRTAADGIEAQSVKGKEIFPNLVPDDVSRPVNWFWACTLGKPSHEIRDPSITTSEYTALYTRALLDALLGKQPELLSWATDGTEIGFLYPRCLRDFLSAEVKRRIKELKLQTKIIQVPDAIITSDPKTAWISRLTSEDVPTSWWLQRSESGLGAPPAQPASPEKPPITTATISTSLVRSALAKDPTRLSRELERARASNIAGARGLAESVERISEPFGMHHQSRCGFKIRGARIVEAHSRYARIEPIEMRSQVLRVKSVDHPGASVLIVFEQGTCVVLPAIPDFIAALTVEEGELVDVAYEPLEDTWRWHEFMQRATEIRPLRAIASSSMTRGVFRLEGDDVLAVARHMQYSKGVDPALATYAAYAYNDLQRRDLIREMSAYMRDDIGAPFFDVAMLAREIDDTKVARDSEIFSFVPLLAQGWALLSAYRISLTQSLAELPSTLVPSLWTMFNAAGVRQIRGIIDSGSVR